MFHFISKFKVHNGVLRNGIHSKNMTIWKAAQLLKCYEVHQSRYASEIHDSFVPIGQQINAYIPHAKAENDDLDSLEVKSKYHNGHLNHGFFFHNELKCVTINALPNVNDEFSEDRLIETVQNRRLAQVLDIMTEKFEQLKLKLMNSETKHDIVLSRFKV